MPLGTLGTLGKSGKSGKVVKVVKVVKVGLWGAIDSMSAKIPQNEDVRLTGIRRTSYGHKPYVLFVQAVRLLSARTSAAKCKDFGR